MSAAGIVIHSGRREVYRGDKRVRLTPQQFEVFHQIWTSKAPITVATIHNRLHALRPACDWPDPHLVVRHVSTLRPLLAELDIVIPTGCAYFAGYTLTKLPTGVQKLRAAA